ncbi:MAG: PQQ-binding-like beta-propeller repeat protein [Phycisphaerae bacterium]|nr:PQQ-binding-like beta-propeller repeat protein [Phycisphaerae bacterium]
MPIRIPCRADVTRFILAGAGAAVLASCAAPDRVEEPAPQPVRRATSIEEDRARIGADREELSKLGLRMEWGSVATVAKGKSVTAFEPFDDLVATLDSSGIVTVLEAASGQPRWNAPVSSEVTRFVGISRADDNLLVCSEVDTFALDLRTSTLRDIQRLAKVANTAPLLAANMLIYGTTSGLVVAHNLFNGIPAWQYQIPGSIVSRVVAAGPYVAVVSQAGRLMILEPASGGSVGNAWVGGGLATDPVATNELIIVASLDQSLYAFSVNGGSLRWRLRTDAPLVHQPACVANRVYVTLPGKGLTCLDAGTGNARWNNDKVTGAVVSVMGGRMVVWDAGSGLVSSVERDSGVLVGQGTLGAVAMLRAEPMEGGPLYAITPAGVISRFRAR